MSGYAFWNGGGSLGPRHVISALPLAFLASGRLFRGAAAHFLTATSVVMMLLAVGAGSIFPERVVNPWAEIIFPVALGEPPVSPNWTWLSLLANIHMPVANLVMLGLIALVWPCPSPQMGVRVLRAASRHGRQNGGWKSAQCDYLLEKEPSSLR
jgi:hypothetical protein